MAARQRRPPAPDADIAVTTGTRAIGKIRERGGVRSAIGISGAMTGPHPARHDAIIALQLDAVLADFAERGARPSPLSVIRHALEAGMSEATATALAAAFEARETSR